jgi:hypothetical protein
VEWCGVEWIGVEWSGGEWSGVFPLQIDRGYLTHPFSTSTV